jgi:hypothetical protein
LAPEAASWPLLAADTLRQVSLAWHMEGFNEVTEVMKAFTLGYRF